MWHLVFWAFIIGILGVFWLDEWHCAIARLPDYPKRSSKVVCVVGLRIWRD
jgi:hypothetical protein